MSVVTWGMIGAGIAALVAGLFLVRARFAAASGAGRVLVFGPVFEAVALTIFAAEHFLAARALAAIVPRWIPGALFWTYFVGGALLAAAISFIAWRYVRWSASLLALLFLIIVATIDLPNLPKHVHERLFWTLTVRETAFAGGAMVLAGSLWPRRISAGRSAGSLLITLGRFFVACTFVFYAIEHFLFPRFVPGVPLEKMTPAWVPAGGLAVVDGVQAALASSSARMMERFILPSPKVYEAANTPTPAVTPDTSSSGRTGLARPCKDGNGPAPRDDRGGVLPNRFRPV